MWYKFIREPLVHFLLAGFILFVLFNWLGPSVSDENTIVVTPTEIQTMMQYRSRAFDQETFAQRWATMSAEEKDQLIHEYIREEVLYQEALKYGLQNNDYVIKQRMIQKVDFIYDQQIDQMEDVVSDSLTQYYEENKYKYVAPAGVTFCHIYFKSDDDPATAMSRAEKLLSSGELGTIGFNDALGYGDRFLYHRNYIEESESSVRSHFGEEFSSSLMQLKPNENQWQGPIASEHGVHLILLTKRVDTEIPPLFQIKSRVKEDYLRDRSILLKNRELNKLIDQYKIKLVDL